MVKLTQSYAHGVSMTPLIGETIGVHFDQAAERWSYPRRADRAPAKRPLELWRAESQNRRVRRRAAGARARAGRSGRHLVAEQLRMGDHAIRDGEGRSHPRQHQPRVSPVRARIRAQQGRLQGAGHGRFVQVQQLCRHAARARAGDRALRSRQIAGEAAAGAGHAHSHRRGRRPRLFAFRRCARHGRRPPPRRARRPRRQAAIRRPDQHPVHQRHHRRAQGRDADPPQHPQQRLLHRRGDAAHRPRPRLHSGAALSLLRHGARQPRLHHPRRGDGLSRRKGSTRWRRSKPSRRSAAPRSTACPPCSSPSSATPNSSVSISVRCAPASWPARRARSR